jgi:D-inositol-3-phosphate glycosyltransferase
MAPADVRSTDPRWTDPLRADSADGRWDSGASGSLDVPSVVEGSSLAIGGWVMFPSGPARRVTVFVDDGAAVARSGVPRPDLAPVVGSRAAAAGFEHTASLHMEAGGPRRVQVAAIAQGAHGEQWESLPIMVEVRPPAPDARWAETFQRLDQARLAPRAHATSPGRLCVFTHSLSIGGGQLWLQDFLLGVVRLGLASHVRVVSPLDGPLRASLEAEGVSVHITAGFPVEAAHYGGRVIELAALLEAWQCDAVLVNTLGLLVAADAARQAGLPFVWAIHESFGLREFARAGWGLEVLDPALERRWLDVLEAGVLVFEAVSTELLFAAQAPRSRRLTVRYNVDPAEVDAYRAGTDRYRLRGRRGIAADRTVLLCMGVFEPRKAEVPLLHAFARVAAQFPDALLVLVGAHPSGYSTAVSDTIELLGLESRVLVAPIDEDPHAWYGLADVLVSASDVESLPRSMLEAMAFGLPVAAAEVFGVGELLVDGESGWLFDARDGEAMTAALRRVLDATPEVLRDMGRRARTRALEFGSRDFAADIVSAMHAAAAAGAPS